MFLLGPSAADVRKIRQQPMDSPDLRNCLVMGPVVISNVFLEVFTPLFGEDVPFDGPHIFQIRLVKNHQTRLWFLGFSEIPQSLDLFGGSCNL